MTPNGDKQAETVYYVRAHNGVPTLAVYTALRCYSQNASPEASRSSSSNMG